MAAKWLSATRTNLTIFYQLRDYNLYVDESKFFITRILLPRLHFPTSLNSPGVEMRNLHEYCSPAKMENGFS